MRKAGQIANKVSNGAVKTYNAAVTATKIALGAAIVYGAYQHWDTIKKLSHYVTTWKHTSSQDPEAIRRAAEERRKDHSDMESAKEAVVAQRAASGDINDVLRDAYKARTLKKDAALKWTTSSGKEGTVVVKSEPKIMARQLGQTDDQVCMEILS